MDKENKLTVQEVEREYDEKREQITKEYRNKILAIDDEYMDLLNEREKQVYDGIEYRAGQYMEALQKLKTHIHNCRGKDVIHTQEIEVKMAYNQYEATVELVKTCSPLWLERRRLGYEHKRLLEDFARDEKLTALNKEHDEKLAHAGYSVEELPMPDMSQLFSSLKKVAAKSAIDEDELQKLNETLNSLQQKAEELELI